MAARKYATAQDLAAVTATLADMATALQAIATLVVTPAQAPVTQAPVAVKAEAPFIAELKLKHAARTSTPEGFEPCGIHSPACTRSFRADSKGATSHEARAYAADGTYTIVA